MYAQNKNNSVCEWRGYDPDCDRLCRGGTIGTASAQMMNRMFQKNLKETLPSQSHKK